MVFELSVYCVLVKAVTSGFVVRKMKCSCKLQLHEANHIHLNAGIRLKSLCIPPVSIVPHGGQFSVHSTIQHSTPWQPDHRAFHRSAQYPMAVRLPCILPVSTVPHGSRMTMHSTSQHNTPWQSDQKLVRKEAGLRAHCRTLHSSSCYALRDMFLSATASFYSYQ